MYLNEQQVKQNKTSFLLILPVYLACNLLLTLTRLSYYVVQVVFYEETYK